MTPAHIRLATSRIPAGGPIVGTVEGLAGGAPTIALERRATRDGVRDAVEVMATGPISEGAFSLTAPPAPSYDGAVIRLAYELVVRDGAEELARAPVRIEAPDDATLRVDYFGAAVPPSRGSWGGTITLAALAGAVGLGLLVVPWLSPGVAVSSAALAALAGVACVALAVGLPLARWRTERAGWSGPFLGLAPEPSFAIGLLGSPPSILQAMFSIRNVRAGDDYRAGAKPALEVGFELSPRCRDVRRVWAQIDVVESYRVRVERAAESAASKWGDEDVALGTVSAELSRDPDAPSLWAGHLVLPSGLPPAIYAASFGGIEWRLCFIAALEDGSTRRSHARSLRVALVREPDARG